MRTEESQQQPNFSTHSRSVIPPYPQFSLSETMHFGMSLTIITYHAFKHLIVNTINHLSHPTPLCYNLTPSSTLKTSLLLSTRQFHFTHDLYRVTAKKTTNKQTNKLTNNPRFLNTKTSLLFPFLVNAKL